MESTSGTGPVQSTSDEAKQSAAAPQPPALPASDQQDALIYKIAKDAETQLWDRLRNTFRGAVWTLGLVLTAAGISAFGVLPNWIENRTKDSVKAAVEAQFKNQQDEINRLREQTVQQAADAAVRAAEARKQLDDIITANKSRETQLKQEFDAREADLRRQFHDREAKVKELTAQLANLDRVAASVKRVENVDVVALAEKVRQVEKIAGETKADRLVELGQDVERVQKALKAIESHRETAAGRMTFREFADRGRLRQDLSGSLPGGRGFARVYELDVPYGRGFGRPVVVAGYQEARLSGGGGSGRSPAVSVYVVSAKQESCTLRLVVENEDQLSDFTVVWLASEQSIPSSP